MTLLTSQPTLETWIPASWETFVEVAEYPDSAKLKSYYHNGRMQLQIIAWSISPDGSSRRIEASQVLSGLLLETWVEALRRSRQSNQSVVGAWLMTKFR